MIKEKLNFITQNEGGLFCPTANVWIDPIKPVKTALITHAHFDHVSLGCHEYISSYETGLLLKKD